MNKNLVSLFWGVGLIAAGGLALAQTMGYADNLAPTVWIAVFAGISVISLVTYFISGVKNWGWLFPVGIFGALALIVGMLSLGVENPAVASLLFVGIGLPFVVVYFLDRPRNWWALIPAGVMAFLTFTILVVDNLGGEWIGAGLFFFIGLAFLVVYLSKRTRTWAALVAYILFVLGFMPLIALTPRPELAGILFLFATGLPFMVVYLSGTDRWWAIIPAGILLTLGILTAIVIGPGLPGPEYNNAPANTFTLAGFSATFAVVWLRHHQGWARWVTLIGAVAAVAELLSGKLQNNWPLLVIAVGIFLLVTALRSRRAQTS